MMKEDKLPGFGKEEEGWAPGTKDDLWDRVRGLGSGRCMTLTDNSACGTDMVYPV